MKKTYRAVCPRCFRTFMCMENNLDEFCWQCGNYLIFINGETIITSQEKEDESNI